MGTDRPIRLSARVRTALAARAPVVALESTVIAHGLPRPRNLEVARALEAEVSASGAVPATVGVLAGVPAVGMDDEDLRRLASGVEVRKLANRDLAAAVAERAFGATTVSASVWLASRAGLEVLATGGIGGVHRGALPDVSADLTELARTSMLVVCAGAKAVLDLAATREALETAGILVVGWRTDEMPAFYSASSELATDARVESAADVARLWRAHRTLGLRGAILLCVPPPPEHALSRDEVDSAISAALEEAERHGVRGKEVTPFLLTAVAERTGGRSLETNIAVLRGNAQVAAAVALALASE